jgi:hypothetical protein
MGSLIAQEIFFRMDIANRYCGPFWLPNFQFSCDGFFHGRGKRRQRDGRKRTEIEVHVIKA